MFNLSTLSFCFFIIFYYLDCFSTYWNLITFENMIKNFKILWIFYLKLLIPTIFFSLLMNTQLGFTFSNFGLCFILFLPCFHFLIYELRLKDEYYFYVNFGFSRFFLWIFTLSFSVIINIITKLL